MTTNPTNASARSFHVFSDDEASTLDHVDKKPDDMSYFNKHHRRWKQPATKNYSRSSGSWTWLLIWILVVLTVLVWCVRFFWMENTFNMAAHKSKNTGSSTNTNFVSNKKNKKKKQVDLQLQDGCREKRKTLPTPRTQPPFFHTPRKDENTQCASNKNLVSVHTYRHLIPQSNGGDKNTIEFRCLLSNIYQRLGDMWLFYGMAPVGSPDEKKYYTIYSSASFDDRPLPRQRFSSSLSSVKGSQTRYSKRYSEQYKWDPKHVRSHMAYENNNHTNSIDRPLERLWIPPPMTIVPHRKWLLRIQRLWKCSPLTMALACYLLHHTKKHHQKINEKKQEEEVDNNTENRAFCVWTAMIRALEDHILMRPEMFSIPFMDKRQTSTQYSFGVQNKKKPNLNTTTTTSSSSSCSSSSHRQGQ